METMRDGGDHWDDGGHEGLYGLWRKMGAIGMVEVMRDGGDHEGWWRALGWWGLQG